MTVRREHGPRKGGRLRPRLPYGRQWIDEDDIAAVTEVLRSDWLTTGPKVAEFEERFATLAGAREAVAVSSGRPPSTQPCSRSGLVPATRSSFPR